MSAPTIALSMDHPHHDLVISATEINDHHGVGILLQRFFPESGKLVTLRSLSVYNGEETFGIGHHELKSAFLTLAETEVRLKEILAPYRIRRILCVPYCREDFIHGVLAQKLTKAPLCTYIMDDQNIFSTKVPDHWVDSLLSASNLCFGISPELCAAYEHKYHRKINLLPPLIEREEPLVPCYWQPEADTPLKVAMIGNVWTADRLKQLRTLLRTVDLHVDWYGSGPDAAWLPGTPEEWEADNIHCLGFLPEEDLVASLASYPCVLVPSGSLDADDDNLSFSRLSLPSRLIFLHTRTDTPVLLLGSNNSAAGRLILHLGTGVCATYNPPDLFSQLARLLDQTEHKKLRQAIRHWAPHFILPNAGQWLWDSLAEQTPLPATFHDAFKGTNNDGEWLNKIAPAKAKYIPPPLTTKQPLNDEAMEAFAFLRTSLLPFIAPADTPPPPQDDLEITELLERFILSLLPRLLPKGGNLLVLGLNVFEWTTKLPADFSIWCVRDIEAWQRNGFPDEPGYLVSLNADQEALPPAVEFDAIVSSTWLDQVSNSDALEKLATYLTLRLRPGGINLHALTAILHPNHFWTAPSHAYLRSHWHLNDWPDLDAILTSPDLFIMGKEGYEIHWQPSTGKSYEDYGKVIGLMLFSRKEMMQKSAASRRSTPVPLPDSGTPRPLDS